MEKHRQIEMSRDANLMGQYLDLHIEPGWIRDGVDPTFTDCPYFGTPDQPVKFAPF